MSCVQQCYVFLSDYAPYNTDSNCNQDNGNEVQSPVQQNPTVDVGFKMQGLRLAINTGKKFSDSLFDKGYFFFLRRNLSLQFLSDTVSSNYVAVFS